MAIKYHPPAGTILMCNYSTGFAPPEMVKLRPVIVISPPIRTRHRLATVVPLSTSEPDHNVQYNAKVRIDPPLPHPFDKREVWIKGDLVAAVSYDRLDLIRAGKDENGKRQYRTRTVPDAVLNNARACVLASLGLANLTKHL